MFWKRDGCRPLGRLLVVASIGIACFSVGAEAADAPNGWATCVGNDPEDCGDTVLTGGAGGSTVIATTGAQFKSLAEQSGPRIILVEGSLAHGGTAVASNKTIIGLGSDAALIGRLSLRTQNIIIRNLSISNPDEDGGDDAIEARGGTHIWIDHNNIFDAPDGLLDIVREADFVTVSWNKFYYTTTQAHRFALLIGNDDGATADRDKLRVTLHHNHWGALVDRRMPRIRYGDVHSYNEYFNSVGNGRCIRAAIEADVLIENSYFESVHDPYAKTSSSARVEASGNVFVNTTGATDAGDDVFEPPYAYTLDDAQDVKDMVLAGAGVGQLCEFNAAPDGDFLLSWSSNTDLQWNPSICATSYNVYRLTAARMPDVDGDGLADDYGTCDLPGLETPQAVMPGTPAPSLCDYILVTGKNVVGESALGDNGAAAPVERPNVAPCP